MLLNESSSGFGVLVGGLPSISANQRAKLHNDRGCYDCRIVYAREVVPTAAMCNSADPCAESEDSAEDDVGIRPITAADIKEFTAGTEGPWFRLGIRCLGKIAPPSSPPTALPIESGGFHPTQCIKSMLASVFGR
jgi:hypothetical protein